MPLDTGMMLRAAGVLLDGAGVTLGLSALAILLSVAFVAGSLIFSDTVTRTFDRLFAHTSADVTVKPKTDLKSSVPTGESRTVPAALAKRLATVPGVKSTHADVGVEKRF